MHYVVRPDHGKPWTVIRVEDTGEEKDIGYSACNLTGELDFCATQINNLLAEVVKLQKEVEFRDVKLDWIKKMNNLGYNYEGEKIRHITQQRCGDVIMFG